MSGYDNFKDNNNLYIHDVSLKENKIEIDSVVYGLLQKVALNPDSIKFYSVDDLDCIVLSITKPNPIVFLNENNIDIELLKQIKTEPVRFSNFNDVNVELLKQVKFEGIKISNKNDIDIILKSLVKPSSIKFQGTIGRYIDGVKIANGLSIKLTRLRKLSEVQEATGQSLLSDWENKSLQEFLYKEI